MYSILLLALVACALGHHEMDDQDCCSMGDKDVTLEAWESVWSSKFGSRRVTIGLEIFKELFENAPDSQALFKHVHGEDLNSPEFNAHVVRVLNGLDLAVNLEYNSDALFEQLHHLGEKHGKIEGMKEEYFDVFREATVHVLEQAIPCFDTDAWRRCMGYRQHVMAGHLTDS